MILVTHIAFAFISLVFVSYTALFPSKTRLHATYFLALSTILSGLVLLLVNPSRLGQVCVSGIVYLAFMIPVSMIARKRLAIKIERSLT